MARRPAGSIAPVVNPDLSAGRRHRMFRASRAIAATDRSAPIRQVHHRDAVIGPLALEFSCRQLLLRVQRAIADILSSDIYAADLRGTVPERMLRQHEWEIAVALRDITELQAEHVSSASAGGTGPMTAAVLASHHRALRLAQDATASRVSALERYAAQVGAADAAQRDWQSAMRISGMNDRYLDLVARTAADEHAIAEIAGLTEQAAAAARIYYDSLEQVTVAAEALVLPAAGADGST